MPPDLIAIPVHDLSWYVHATQHDNKYLHAAQIKLSRYDLFHAHLFLGTHDVTADCTDWSKTVTSHNTPAEGKEGHDTNPALMQLGLLFHTQEYPQFCEHSFPFQLGWCQAGSDVVHEPHAFNKRNILWYGGTLAALDTGN